MHKLLREPGVTSQYESHVHPYPTRFHGGIWARPSFSFPYNQSPSTVFKPSDWAEGIPGSAQVGEPGIAAGVHGYYSRYPWRDYRKPMTFMNYGSMGALGANPVTWKVGEGVFRNGITAGGGIFNTAIDGLGSLGGGFGAEMQKGLTALSSTEVSSLQASMNPKLQQMGYCPIAVDGKLGPMTCQAGMVTLTNAIIAACGSIVPKPLSKPPCPGVGLPSPGGGGAPPPVTQFTPPMMEEGMSTQTKALLVGGAAAGLFLWLWSRKRRGKS